MIYDLLPPSQKTGPDDLYEDEVLLEGSEKPIRTKTWTGKFIWEFSTGSFLFWRFRSFLYPDGESTNVKTHHWEIL